MKRIWIRAMMEQARPDALIAAIAGVTLLVALASYLYVLKPVLGDVRDLGEETAGDMLAEGVVESVGSAAIAQLQAEVSTMRGRVYGGGEDVPLEHSESWIIDRLDQLSLRHAVQLLSVTPKSRRSVLMFDELPYDVHIKASYFDLFAWLDEVERELRPLVVKEFDLHGESGGQVDMKVQLVSYRPRGGDV